MVSVSAVGVETDEKGERLYDSLVHTRLPHSQALASWYEHPFGGVAHVGASQAWDSDATIAMASTCSTARADDEANIAIPTVNTAMNMLPDAARVGEGVVVESSSKYPYIPSNTEIHAVTLLFDIAHFSSSEEGRMRVRYVQ